MKKILILYFSGAGATKRVAQDMHADISRKRPVDIFPMEHGADLDLNQYGALIIGTPVHHAAPARVVSAYFDGLRPLCEETPAFLFNTRAMCAMNTNRILAKQIRSKHIIAIMDRAYRGPASDGSLIVPFIRRFFTFERELADRIHLDCAAFLRLLDGDAPRGYIPRFRLSSVINAPNKLAGQRIRFKIHLHRDRCVQCGHCIESCPGNALRRDPSGYPALLAERCGSCYRCIHHCPRLALSLSRRRAPKRVLGG